MANTNGQSPSRVAPDGLFPNGVSVVSVIRFIRAYDYEADRNAVADYFGLEPKDVDAAVAFHAQNFDWVHPTVMEAER